MPEPESVAKRIEPLFSKRRKRQFVNRSSTLVEFSNRNMSEWEIIESAAKAAGVGLDEYVHDRLLTMAKRDLSMAKARKKMKSDERHAGVPGAADKRIERAYDELKKTGQPITIGALRRLAPAGFAVVKRWVERNADNLDVPIVSEAPIQYGPRSTNV